MFDFSSMTFVLFQFNVRHLCVSVCVRVCRLRDMSSMFVFLILVLLSFQKIYCVCFKVCLDMLVPVIVRACVCPF